MSEAIRGLCEFSAGALLLLCVGWIAYLAGARLVPGSSTTVRWSAGVVCAYGLLVGLFHVLLALHAFRILVALPMLLAGAVIAHAALARVTGARALLAVDARRIANAIASLRGSILGALVLIAASVLAARLLRGLVAPPLAWDALTYHLFKAGRWVQEGRALVQQAPDAWGYYEHFPSAGDSLWAWSLLAAPDGMLLAPAGALVWGTVVLATHAAARVMGARSRTAILAALSVGVCPAVAGALTAAYVDNTVLALLVLAFLFLGRFLDAPRLADSALAAGSLGLATAVKIGVVPVLVLGFVLVVARSLALPTPWSRRMAMTLVFVAAAALCLGDYVTHAIEKGSPLYPFPVRVAGREILRGNDELALVLSSRLPALQRSPIEESALLPTLFLPSRFPGSDELGLGPGGILIALLGIAGTISLVRDRRRRLPILFFLGASACLTLGLLSADVLALRTVWVQVAGRFLTPVLALLAVVGAQVRLRLAEFAWGVAIVLGSWLSIPRGWSAPDREALAWTLALAALVLAVAYASVRAGCFRGHPGWRAGVVAALLLVPAGAALPRLRGACRYEIYAAADSEPPAYDLHPLSALGADSWPIWRFLDQDRSLRVAASAGWDGVGHNGFLYPLLGSRLQNRVSYVTPTIDGTVVDYREDDEIRRRMDARSWMRRLVDQQIDYVVTLAPAPPELAIIRESSPGIFTESVSAAHGPARAFRFDRDRAAEFLGAGNPPVPK